MELTIYIMKCNFVFILCPMHVQYLCFTLTYLNEFCFLI